MKLEMTDDGREGDGTPPVSIFFELPDTYGVTVGEMPYFGVTVDGLGDSYFADAFAVLETEIPDQETADIAAEWLEYFAKKLREKWALVGPAA